MLDVTEAKAAQESTPEPTPRQLAASEKTDSPRLNALWFLSQGQTARRREGRGHTVRLRHGPTAD